ncbi:hypothetical protein AOLI_G00231660 [Acnodon oligacanthus]
MDNERRNKEVDLQTDKLQRGDDQLTAGDAQSCEEIRAESKPARCVDRAEGAEGHGGGAEGAAAVQSKPD